MHYLSHWHIGGQTTWPPFCRRHFETRFRDRKVLNLQRNFIEICAFVSNWQQGSSDSGDAGKLGNPSGPEIGILTGITRPNYSDAGDGIVRFLGPIPCLLMHWLLKSPEHQQAWYWLCRTDGIYCCSRVNFIYLGQAKPQRRFKMWIYILYSLKQFSVLRVLIVNWSVMNPTNPVYRANTGSVKSSLVGVMFQCRAKLICTWTNLHY